MTNKYLKMLSPNTGVMKTFHLRKKRKEQINKPKKTTTITTTTTTKIKQTKSQRKRRYTLNTCTYYPLEKYWIRILRECPVRYFISQKIN